jgi:predicted O-linked N-acetylglucosamine transferase (SPINDLY family)
MEPSEHAELIFERALALHQGGSASEAREGYLEVLRLRPGDALALKMLGTLALEDNEPEEAIRRFTESLSYDPTDLVTHIYKGSAHSLRREHEAAIACYDHVISIDPETSALPYYSRGTAQLELKEYSAAAESFRQAIALESDLDAECYFCLGFAEQALGRREAAIASLDRAILLGTARGAQAHAARGTLLHELGDFAGALAAFDAALALQPHWVEMLNGRGLALVSLGRSRDARQCFEAAAALAPDHVPTLNNLARTLEDLGEVDSALSVYGTWMRVDRDGGAFGNAGGLLFAIGRLDEAEDLLRRGIERFPTYAPLYVNLGNVLNKGGNVTASLECYRHALRIDPKCAVAHSNLAFSLMFVSEDPQSILEECRRFGSTFGAAITPARHAQARALAERRLRVGYVSPDFRSHCQSCFTLPLLTHHDRSAFEVICYSTARRADAITQRIRGLVHEFRDVGFLDDEAIATRIRDDKIDVLVDLTMHMSGGRPLIFARRPAPVQIAWLAYPGTTGMAAMDFRLSDPRLDPSDFESRYSERTIRLEDSFWCFDPLSQVSPVGEPPSRDRGYLTFGCLNNPCKLTERTLQLWSPVFEEVPMSRLLLLIFSKSGRQRVVECARNAGIDPARIDFVEFQPRDQYLKTYGKIDICLDTLPYNGHTTTLDSLWMGVPVVTRVGPTVVGRAGLSLLHHVGLTDLVAHDDRAFVDAAVNLAVDLKRLTLLRKQLRPRLEQSPLMDGPRFAMSMEAALRRALLSP